MNYAFNHGSQGNLLNCAPAPVQTQSNASNEVDTKSVDDKIGASIRKAALEGNVTELQALLNKYQGTDYINSSDVIGTTPLHTAASHGQLECVKLLLKAGADRNAKNHYGQTPATHAQGTEIKDLLEATTGPEDSPFWGFCAVM